MNQQQKTALIQILEYYEIQSEFYDDLVKELESLIDQMVSESEK